MKPGLFSNLSWLVAPCLAALLLAACGDRKVDQALETDANGFLCRKCSTKFYTERALFPDYCPKCKSAEIDQAIGFVCAADKHVTVGSRARGVRKCEKCGGPTSGVSIPKEADLKTWGATKQTQSEVGGS